MGAKTPGPVAEVVLAQGVVRRLQRDAADMGITLNALQADQLARFAELLLRWNRSFNIVSRKDVARLIPRHILDSLSVAPWLHGPEVLDLGTGGGLPGIPLAILRGDLQFTLVDRSQRKIRFVTQVRRTLSLANVRPLCVDVEELPSVARFDCVVSRGVKDLQRLWELAAPRLRSTPSTTGVLVAMASTRGEASATQIEPELPGGRVFARPVIRIPGSADGHRLDVVEMVEMQGPSGSGD